MIRDTIAAIFNGAPTYDKPSENNSDVQLDTPLIKIAADKYLVHSKSADIKQKTTPTPLLFIVFTSLSNPDSSKPHVQISAILSYHILCQHVKCSSEDAVSIITIPMITDTTMAATVMSGFFFFSVFWMACLQISAV